MHTFTLRPRAKHIVLASALALGLAKADAAHAQTSSLFRTDLPVESQPLTLADSSMIYQAQEPLKTIKLNDLVTIIVDEKSQFVSDADIQRRKQAQLNAQLKNWVELRNFSLKSAPQRDGTPHINGTLQAQFRAQAELQTRDGLKLRITTRVVDIRPNGHLVLEGHQTIRNNDEQWDRSISGIVRPEDILPNNTVLSEDVSELHIAKREQGQVRDGYRRGWFYRLLDRYGMF